MAKAVAKSSALIDTRVIYCGDNLEQLRKLPNACVDLIYMDFREYRERMRRMRPSLISGVAGKMHEANAHLQHNYLDRISTGVGVLSLSARSNSIVMWGHYGDKHRGTVIGFDTAWEVFRFGKGLRPA